MNPRTRLFVLFIGLGFALCPALASATKKNLLEGQPPIRNKYEIRKGRFEVGPSMVFSLNRFLRHAHMVGLKLDYHINDWLSLGAEAGYGIAFNTGLSDELEGQYNDPDPKSGNTPGDWEKKRNRFADIQFAGDVRIAATPMAGKMALFSRLFMYYDFYAFTGFGFALLKNKTDEPDVDKANEGFRPGVALGIGMHIYFTRWFSFGAELKDLIFSDNESGGDLTRGLKGDELREKKPLINGDDPKFSNHLFAGVSFTFFFPTTVEMTP